MIRLPADGDGAIVPESGGDPRANPPSKITLGSFDVPPRPQPRLVETVLVFSIVMLGLMGATAMLAGQVARCLPVF